jgi:hypothetical protein
VGVPAKHRTPKGRRPPPFPPEALALFAELDAVPKRNRESAEFKAKERELMRALDLADAWRFSCCSVLDRSAAPCWPPERPAEHDWHAVRRVRTALLALMKDSASHDRLSAAPAQPE